MTIRRGSALYLALSTFAIICASSLCSCGTFGTGGTSEPDPDLQAYVEIEDPEYGGSAPIAVVVKSKSLREAVGLLRSKRWELAASAFEKYTMSGPRTQQAEAFFGLGVAREKLGDFSGALAAYQEAFTRANTSDYEQAVNRMEARVP